MSRSEPHLVNKSKKKPNRLFNQNGAVAPPSNPTQAVLKKKHFSVDHTRVVPSQAPDSSKSLLERLLAPSKEIQARLIISSPPNSTTSNAAQLDDLLALEAVYEIIPKNSVCGMSRDYTSRKLIVWTGLCMEALKKCLLTKDIEIGGVRYPMRPVARDFIIAEVFGFEPLHPDELHKILYTVFSVYGTVVEVAIPSQHGVVTGRIKIIFASFPSPLANVTRLLSGPFSLGISWPHPFHPTPESALALDLTLGLPDVLIPVDPAMDLTMEIM